MVLEFVTEVVSEKVSRKVLRMRCDGCGTEFVRVGAQVDKRIIEKPYHYCSSACVYEHRRNMEGSYKASPNVVTMVCFGCGVEIKRWKSVLEKTEHSFCSKTCRGKTVATGLIPSNFTFTEEVKRKMSKAAKDRLKDPKNHPMFGKEQSEETKKKISASHMGIHSGDKNPMFGKEHTKETRQLMSELVSERILSGKQKPYGKNGHRTGTYTSLKTGATMPYRSSWELACMQWLDNEPTVLSYAYESVRIPYFVEELENVKQKRYYIPDFLITFLDNHQELWELKPEKLTENSRTQLKAEAARLYCAEHNISIYRILTKKNLTQLHIL